eukprot:scaffold869_cov303-Pinguiococcus_pyrenoidosus.AAC.24
MSSPSAKISLATDPPFTMVFFRRNKPGLWITVDTREAASAEPTRRGAGTCWWGPRGAQTTRSTSCAVCGGLCSASRPPSHPPRKGPPP